MGSRRAIALTFALCAVACAHRTPASRLAALEPPPPPPDDAAPARPTKGLSKKRASAVSFSRKPLDPAARGEPFAWPTHGVLISGFGQRDRDRHEGIDLAAPEGSAIVAAADGTVIFAGTQRGYGNLVLLAHGGDVVTVYAHNSQNLVVPGDKVARGEVIARVGSTGNATGPHVHFEVRVGARPHDPLGFLR